MRHLKKLSDDPDLLGVLDVPRRPERDNVRMLARYEKRHLRQVVAHVFLAHVHDL